MQHVRRYVSSRPPPKRAAVGRTKVPRGVGIGAGWRGGALRRTGPGAGSTFARREEHCAHCREQVLAYFAACARRSGPRGCEAIRRIASPRHRSTLSLFAKALSSIATSTSTSRTLLSASHSGSDPSLAPEGLRLRCPLGGPSFIRNQVRLFRAGYCTVLLSRAQAARRVCDRPSAGQFPLAACCPVLTILLNTATFILYISLIAIRIGCVAFGPLISLPARPRGVRPPSWTALSTE